MTTDSRFEWTPGTRTPEGTWEPPRRDLYLERTPDPRERRRYGWIGAGRNALHSTARIMTVGYTVTLTVTLFLLVVTAYGYSQRGSTTLIPAFTDGQWRALLLALVIGAGFSLGQLFLADPIRRGSIVAVVVAVVTNAPLAASTLKAWIDTLGEHGLALSFGQALTFAVPAYVTIMLLSPTTWYLLIKSRQARRVSRGSRRAR